MLAGTALAAYSIGGVPVQWIAQSSVAILGILVLAITGRIPSDTSTRLLAVFIAWCGFVTIVNLGRIPAMPAGATLPYPVFVTLRFVSLFAFAAALLLTRELGRRGHADQLLRAVVWIGIAVSVVAVYIHLAQWFGLPEPPRTRLGTGGGEQATTFTSGALRYHRALGTFREPTHMAEWLLLPLFASVALGGRVGLIGAAVSMCAIVLSISLTGLVSVAAGFVGGLWLSNPLRRRNLVRLFVAILVLLGGAVLLQFVTIGTDEEALSVAGVIQRRFEDLAATGLGGSSRSLWTDLLSSEQLPVVGHGFGNSNLIASAALGSDLVVSYVSLYMNVLYSAGIVGLVLLSLFLLQPLKMSRGGRSRRAGQALLMGYIAYLVAFVAGSEELSVPFGMAAGLLHHFRARSERLAPRVFAVAATPAERPAGR